MKSAKILISLAILSISFLTAQAQQNQQVKLFDDLRVVGWSADFLAGKREQLLLSVEADLKSPNPHPFAPHVWTMTQDTLGTLDKSLAEMKDEKLRRAIGDFPEIWKLYCKGETVRILEKFPASRAEEFTDPMVLHTLFFSATAEFRYDDALIYITRMFRLYPNYFQPAWAISQNLFPVERMRVKIAALLNSDKSLAETPVGIFLRQRLEMYPSQSINFTADYLAMLDEWLKKYPNDTRALRAKGAALRGLGKSEESIAVFLEANRVYPFFNQNLPSNFNDATTELMKLGKIAEAEELLRQQTILRCPDAEAATMYFEELRAQSLLDSEKIGTLENTKKAAELLDAAILKYPKNTKLLLLRANSGFKDWKNERQKYLFYARRAVEIEPESFANREYLLEALMNTRHNNEAIKVFGEIEEKFNQLSPQMFWSVANSQLYLLNFDESLKICHRAVEKFPESEWMRRNYAFILLRVGRNDEALAELKKSWEITPPSNWTLRLTGQILTDTKDLESPDKLQELKNQVYEYEELLNKAAEENEKLGSGQKRLKQAVKDGTSTLTYEQINQKLSELKTELEKIEGELKKEKAAEFMTAIEKKFPGFKTRFPFIKLTSVSELALDGDALEWIEMQKAFQKIDKTGLRSVADNSTSRVVYQPTLRLQLESLDEKAVFSPKEDLIISSGGKGNLLFWDAASGKVTLKAKEHSDEIRKIKFTKNGDFFATGSDDGKVKLWNTQTRAVVREFEGFTGYPIDINFSSDGSEMFVYSELESTSTRKRDKLITQLSCWNIASGEVRWTQESLSNSQSSYYNGQIYLSPSQSSYYNGQIYLSPDGNFVALDGSRIFNARTGEKYPGLDGEQFAFRVDGTATAVNTNYDEIAVYKFNEKSRSAPTLITNWSSAQSSCIPCRSRRKNFKMFLSFDGTKIIVSTEDNKLVVVDTATENILQTFQISDKHEFFDFFWSPDSKNLLTFSSKETLPNWEELESRKELDSPKKPYTVTTALFSVNSQNPVWRKDETSKTVAATDNDNRAPEEALWSLQYLNEIETRNTEFSPSGKTILSYGRFYNAATGLILNKVSGTAGNIQSVALSPNGRYLWAAQKDFYEKITKKPSETNKTEKVEDGENQVSSETVQDTKNNKTNSGNEKTKEQKIEVIGGSNGAFDLQQGIILPHLYTQTGDNLDVFFDSQNRLITRKLLPKEKLEELAGTNSYEFEKTSGILQFQSVSSDKPTAEMDSGASFFLVSRDGTLGLTTSETEITAWNLGGDLKKLWSIEIGKDLFIYEIELSQDNKKLAVTTLESMKNGNYSRYKISIWNIAARKPEKVLFENANTESIVNANISNRTVGNISNSANASNSESENRGADDIGIKSLTFSPDGKYLAGYAYYRNSFQIWNVETKEVKTIKSKEENTYTLEYEFSKDGKYLIAYYAYGGEIVIVDIVGGVLLHSLPDTEAVSDLEIAPNGTDIFVVREEAGEGRRIEIWNFLKKEKRGTIYVFNDNSWVIIDAEGRYDSSNNGDNPGLYWVVGTDVIQVSQLKQRFYEPGLLAKLTGFNNDAVRDVSAIKDIKLYPTAELTPLAPNSTKTTLTVTNRGGGIGKIEVYINDSLKEDAIPRGDLPNPKQEKFVQEIDLERFRRFMLTGQNEITVKTYNEEGYLASRGTRVYYILPPEKVEPPALWALFVGVSDYAAGDLRDLKYAAIDAENMAKAIGATSRKFFPDRTHIRLLTTSNQKPEEKPNKANIERILREFADAEKGARANDVLLIYFAGHGVSYINKADNNNDDFYFLTMDAVTGNLNDDSLRKKDALSGEEIAQLVGNIAANKKVMILDTCASGKFVQIYESRDPDSSTIRGWDRMKDRQGLWILAGSAANAVSYESSRYGQGVLTYSILQGMYRDFEQVTDKAVDNNQFEMLDVSKLFQYSRDNVPNLAQGIGGIQKPVIASKKDASSFYIGRLDGAARGLVPYTQEKPVYLSSSFQLQTLPLDDLGLTALINEKLNREMTRGLEAKLVFWESVPKFAGAYRLAGRYEINETSGEVKVTVYLFSFQKEGENFKDLKIGEPFVVTGEKSKPEKLADDILNAANKIISELPKTK